MTDVRNHANLVWGIAELLRGDYKQADYGTKLGQPTRAATVAHAARAGLL